jgi:hypothetical protein
MFEENMIPYMIMEAHPDNKMPYISHIHGIIEETKLNIFILEKQVEFIYNRINIEEINSIKDVEYFWSSFYDDCYMDNPPWEAFAVINCEWKYISYSNIELFEALISIKDLDIYLSDNEDNITMISVGSDV